MVFRKKFEWTILSNEFINTYMPHANGTYVKVYIYWEMKSQMGDFSMDLLETAKALSLSIEDVKMARDYWIEEGVLYEDEGSMESKDLIKHESPQAQSEPSDKMEDEQANNAPLDKDVELLLQANQVPDFKRMFLSVDAILQRETSPNEKMELVSFMTECNMNPDVITEAFKITKMEGKKNFNYAIGIIKNWYGEGITNSEQLEEYIKESSEEERRYREIAKLMGMKGYLPEASKEIVDKWFNDYNFNMEIINEGMKKLISTNNPNIKYVDKIFSTWHEKGVRTLEDIENIKEGEGQKPSNKKKYDNFEERDNECDEADFEYHNQQKIKKLLEEESE